MSVLSSSQRKLLEDACVAGRVAAEQAARAAISVLAVTAVRPPVHLSEEQRHLRRGLRAKARQLGDTGEQVDLLVADCAYEQWHRLLFARFLADNKLLVHPGLLASVTIEDCEELAVDLGEPDGWSVAARFAAEILPGIFRLDDPCVQVRLATEGRLQLEAIVSGLPAALLVADDALGWVYQYWQTSKKSEVNDSGQKVGSVDLGPVTQLFTENYMVRFLLENSLGAWWAARHPGSPLISEWRYLRRDHDGQPAAGTFDGWPSTIAEVTVMDPCCGSGHFLVEAFKMLWRIRAVEDGLENVAAQDAVLRDNLFGLELDPRCVQIAMFALAVQAWKDGDGWRDLPIPHVACSGTPAKGSAAEWAGFAQDDEQLAEVLRSMHALFRDADDLGSLISPRQILLQSPQSDQLSFDDVDWAEVAAALSEIAGSEASDPAAAVFGIAASGLARTVDYLSRTFTLVCTNPPFLDHKKQSQRLVESLKRLHPLSFRDLACAMLERCLTMSEPGGAIAMVTPALWASARPFERFRRSLLGEAGLELTANLGTGAFEAISGEVVNVLLMISSYGYSTSDQLVVLDVSATRSPSAKGEALCTDQLRVMSRAGQFRNPMTRFMFVSTESLSFLRDFSNASAGIQTGDNNRFHRCFWELGDDREGWVFLQRSPEATHPRTGMHLMLLWEDGKGELRDFIRERLGSESIGAWVRGLDFWGREGVVVSRIGDVPATLYSGQAFADNAVVLVPKRNDDLAGLWAFCSSDDFVKAVRSVDNRLSVTVGTFMGTPIDIERWRSAAALVAAVESTDPTQWLFRGRPEVTDEPLQVGVARLVGYRWPEQPEDDDLVALADDDGIVCLPSVRGERAAADRLQDLLAKGFGSTWSSARNLELIARTGSSKKDLDSWLRDDFFKAHCQLFKNRPFVWQVWDGRTDGFSALVNYHRLDRPALERLTYSYLGDWIERQRAGVRDDTAGAVERLAAAVDLQRRLTLIIDGEPPHDIYVRWRSLARQSMGWEPNLSDGVRLNIRPFVTAGVLRGRLNVHWKADGGKSNDLHFTQSQKMVARKGSG